MTPEPGRPDDPAGSTDAVDDGAADIIETQVERTELAWARTALASAGLGALSLHLTFDDLGPTVGLAVGTLAATPGLVAAWWRIRGLRAAPVVRPPAPLGVAVLAGSVAFVEVATLALILA